MEKEGLELQLDNRTGTSLNFLKIHAPMEVSELDYVYGEISFFPPKNTPTIITLSPAKYNPPEVHSLVFAIAFPAMLGVAVEVPGSGGKLV